MASLEFSALVLDCVEASHPRLSGVILNVVNAQATLLIYLPLDCVLECFGGLHKASQSGIHAYLLLFRMCILARVILPGGKRFCSEISAWFCQ